MTMPTLIRDALRQSLRRPGVSALLVLILALGIGVNAALFELAHTAVLRPLPVAQPDSLVRLFTRDPNSQEISNGSYPWFQWLAGMPAFADVAAYNEWNSVAAAPGDGPAQRRLAGLGSGSLFEVLGVTAARGRVFGPDDDRAVGQHPVVVLTDAYWRSQLAADPDVLGSTLRINGEPYAVIGVLPPGFVAPSLGTKVDFWLPLAMASKVSPSFVKNDFREREDQSWLDIVARLAPDTGLDAAQAQLDARADAVVAARPQGAPVDGRGPHARAMSFRAAAIDPYGTGGETRNAWLLVAVALVVLLIACANAAGLLLVRGQERLRELALRASLGASVGRLRGQLLTEAGLLALAGMVAGVVLARVLVDVGRQLAPSALLQPADAAGATLSPLVLALACACALVGLLLAAVLPSWRLARVDACAVLRAGEQHSTHGPRSSRWRTGLVTVQLALTLVLLIGAGLLLRSLANVARLDPGFKTGNALVASIDPGPEQQAPGAWPRRLEQIGANIAAQPGVESVAWMNSVPVLNNGMRSTVQSDHPDSPVDDQAHAYFNVVSPGAFATLGVPLLRGREFAAADDGRAPVAIVNAAYAERFFPGVDPIGRRIVSLSREQGGAVVVGLVADHRQRSLRETPQPQVYVPTAQFFPTRMSLLVRGRGDLDALALALPRLVAAIDRDQPVHGVRTLEQQLGLGQAEQQTFAWLFGGFGVLACVLAAAGLYGLLAGWLRSRVREIGIRLAVGAGRGRIARLLLGQALRLWLLGAGLGLALSVLAGRSLGSLLHGVGALDPPTIGLALLVLATVAALATGLPLRRALRVDPIIALRHD